MATANLKLTYENSMGSGVSCTFYRLSKKWGFKKFHNEHKLYESIDNHAICFARGFAPQFKVLKQSVQVDHKYKKGYFLEVIDQLAKNRIDKLIQQNKEDLTFNYYDDYYRRYQKMVIPTYVAEMWIEQMDGMETPSYYAENAIQKYGYRVAKAIKRVFKQVKEDYEKVFNACHFIQDRHTANWGYINNKPVIIDFGCGM